MMNIQILFTQTEVTHYDVTSIQIKAVFIRVILLYQLIKHARLSTKSVDSLALRTTVYSRFIQG